MHVRAYTVTGVHVLPAKVKACIPLGTAAEDVQLAPAVHIHTFLQGFTSPVRNQHQPLNMVHCAAGLKYGGELEEDLKAATGGKDDKFAHVELSRYKWGAPSGL